MRNLMLLTMLTLILLVGCAQRYQAFEYQGPQDWPTGRASISHTAINDAKVIYGLPERPYEVVQIVEIPRQGMIPDKELRAVSGDMHHVAPDALVLVGTKYDRVLDVEQHLARAKVDERCMQLINKVRKINRDDTRKLVFLAIRWKDATGPEPSQIVKR